MAGKHHHELDILVSRCYHRCYGTTLAVTAYANTVFVNMLAILYGFEHSFGIFGKKSRIGIV